MERQLDQVINTQTLSPPKKTTNKNNNSCTIKDEGNILLDLTLLHLEQASWNIHPTDDEILVDTSTTISSTLSASSLQQTIKIGFDLGVSHAFYAKYEGSENRRHYTSMISYLCH